MRNQTIKFNTKKLKEKNSETQKAKQKSLIEKIKKVQNSQSELVIQTSEINYEEKYTKLLKENGLIKAKNEYLQEKVAGLNKIVKENKINQTTIEKFKNQIKELKSENFIKQNTVSELSLKISKMKKEIDALKIDNTQLTEELEKKSEVKYERIIEQLQREIEIHVGRIEPLKKIVDKLQTERDEAINKTLSLENQLKVAESKFTEIKAKLRSRSKELDKFYENVPISKLVSLLDKRLTLPNVFAFYQIDKLILKYHKLKNIAKINEKKEREKRNKDRLHKERMTNSKKINGYIIKNEEDWYFYDLNNKTYLITDSKIGLVPDMPASAAVYEDGSAYVFYIYFETNDETQELKDQDGEKRDKTIVKKEPKSYDQFGDGLRILIVGSRHKLLYTSELSNHGFEVDWHNPFEDSLNRIAGQVSKADIVLVCTSHINHIVMTYIDEDDQKIELIQKDTLNRMVVRARYTAIKLGLIG